MVEHRERIGRQLGNYRLVQHIAQRGFADVYLGEHISLKTLAAIKMMHTELDGEEVEQFIAQARLVSSLQHPHIAQVLEFGLENNSPFLVMDYAPNNTLRQLHPKGTRLPLSTIVSYVNQIAEALQYIHDQNLIHRDIKPHNMLLGPNHEVILSDFGIAIVSQSTGYRLQKIQDFEGTILYAAPEQIRGRPRFASDQYALGVVVYEWLSGNSPFYGSVEEIASQHTLSLPPSLLEQVPSIPYAVEQVVLKALAKEPGERFESVTEFAKALERASRLELPGAGTRQTSPFPLSPSSPLPVKMPSTEETVQSALLTYRGHADKVHMLAWSPDNMRIASSSLDETVQVWHTITGDNFLTYRCNSLQAQAIAWSPDGKFIASTCGLLSESVQIWDAFSGHNSPKHPTYSGHAESVQAIAWSPDGKLIASAGDDATVQVWELTTGRTIFTYRGHSLAVKSVAWSSDGKRIASCSEDKTVQIWNATTRGNVVAYYAHRDKVNGLAWSPGGAHIASASDDGTVHVWDASNGHKFFIYSGHSGSVTNVAWSPDGLRVASSSLDESVQVWHAITGSINFTYTGHSDWVSTIAWSPDGMRIASGSWDKTVQIWEI